MRQKNESVSWKTEWCKSLLQKRKKTMKRNEDRRHLWDNVKCTNIHIIGAPEGERREKVPKKIFKT